MAISHSLAVTQSSQDVANNKSKVAIVWKSTQTGESYNNYTRTAYYYVSINGGSETRYSVNYTLPKGTTKTIVSTTITVPHRADGTASVKVRTWMDTRISAGVVEQTKTLTLTTIPRATTPDASNYHALFGASVTISMPRASSDFTHDLSYRPDISGQPWVQIASGLGTSYSWTIPDLSAKIPNATSVIVDVRCVTKQGSNVIGTKIISIEAILPSTYIPTVNTLTATDLDSAIKTQFGAFVQNKSIIKIAATASGVKSSTIKQYRLSFNGLTAYASTLEMEDPIAKSGTLSATAYAVDSRDRRSATKSLNVTVLPYSPPKVTRFDAYRVDSSGNADDNGTRLAIRYAYAAATLNNKNTVSAVIEYKKASDTEWTELATLTALSADTTLLTSGVVFSIDYQYDVRITVTDWFGAIGTGTDLVPSEEVILDISADGKGLKFGGASERLGVEFGWDAKGRVFGLGAATAVLSSGDNLNSYLTPAVYAVETDAVAASLINCPSVRAGTLRVYNAVGRGVLSGNYVYFMQEYRSRNIFEPTYRRMCSTNSTGVWTYSDWVQDTTGLIETGSWTPDIPEASVSEAVGYYSKVGDMVTLSWKIVATINSTKYIRVSGVPFVAATSDPIAADDLFEVAGGGGFGTGKTSSGRTFVGWALTRAGSNANPTFWDNCIIAVGTEAAYYSLAVGDYFGCAGTLTYKAQE